MRPAAGRLVLAGIPLFALAAGGAEQPIPADAPRVRLLSPGRAPQRALRYRAATGQKGQLKFSMTMAMEMSIGQQALPSQSMPEMRYGMEYTVTKVSPEGDIRYEFGFKDAEAVPGPGVAPAVLEAMRSYMGKMESMRGHVLVTSRGIIREADLVMPEGVDAQLRQIMDGMRQSLRQLGAPFPEEPVGVGAKWETITHATQNGITLDQTALNELTSLQGESGLLAVTIKQTAEPQQLQPPNLPAGTRVDLTSFSSTGGGQTAFDLGSLLPTRCEVKLHMEMGTTVQAGAEKQPMTMKMDMAMTMMGR
jgi:hypothetical protein